MIENYKKSSLRPNATLGFWKILRLDPDKPYYYICQCICGAIHSIRKWSLLDRSSKSCGCKLIESMKKTNRKRYKCDFTQQNESVQKKSKETLLSKYNVENYAHCEERKEQIKQTNLKNHNEEHHSQTEEWKQKMKKIREEKKKKIYGKIVYGK